MIGSKMVGEAFLKDSLNEDFVAAMKAIEEESTE